VSSAVYELRRRGDSLLGHDRPHITNERANRCVDRYSVPLSMCNVGVRVPLRGAGGSATARRYRRGRDCPIVAGAADDEAMQRRTATSGGRKLGMIDIRTRRDAGCSRFANEMFRLAILDTASQVPSSRFK
jgi:hypothetical protein